MSKRRGSELGNREWKIPRIGIRNKFKILGVEERNPVDRRIAGYVELPNFNHELIPDILSFLPAESLLKFKCVSKGWVSFIQEKSLIKKHLSRAGSTIHFHLDPPPQGETFRYLASILGLLLEQCSVTKKCRIRNPTTRQVFHLPDPPEDNGVFLLGFSYSQSCFKVIWIHDKEDDPTRCAILTLGSNDPSWRTLSFPNSKCANTPSEGTEITDFDEAVHYVRIGTNISKFFEIITLDIEDESFTFTTLPKSSFVQDKQIWIFAWEECLTFGTIVEDKVDMLMLEDYNTQIWNRTEMPLPFLKHNPDVYLDQIVGDDGLLSFWLYNGKIFYTTEDKEVICDRLQLGDENLYCYRKTLVSFEGMQPQT